jgi:proteasome lid subunit RPN8/RPN11
VRSVLITETALADVRALAARRYPSETGGVLVGVKARQTAWIVAAIELQGESSSRHYEVPKGAAQRAVLQAREQLDPRVGYVGEWHSHTDDSGPSSMDRAIMRAIAWFGTPPTWRGPCLVLVRRNHAGYVVGGYRASFPRLVPIELVPTGPLPNPPAK